ncbi:MAG: glycoside hydrolase family 88 protein [Blautia sp.]|nr:glycoside hydrolase family 88 protein [Blautia sp.]
MRKIEELLSETEKSWAGEVFEKIHKKLDWVSEKNREKIPYTTQADGSYADRSDQAAFGEDWGLGMSWWTNGFWAGLLWQMYHATGEKKYMEIAGISEKKMDACFLQYYGLHHDVGFMWMPTAVADYRLTGNPESRKRGLLAAQLLAGRYNPAGAFIRAWNDIPDADATGWAIIDCMFNISLLYWASEETGDPRFCEIARKHADTVQKTFIREDGSSNHIVEFDPVKGGVVRTHGGQGYRNGSAWTRGQAWALYGFTISYLHTGKKEYLETAKKVADYFSAHMREDGIIPVDFLQPAKPDLEDSCGAVVAAGGFLELAECILKGEDGTPEDNREAAAGKYLEAALRILYGIDEKRSCWGKECDAIVQNCTGAYHSSDHHITMVYADYYFVEAILKLTGNGFFMW